MNKPLLLSLIGIALCCQPLTAAPLVELPSGDWSCSVTVTPDGPDQPDAAKAPAKPSNLATMQSIEMTQIGKLRRSLTTWSDGEVSEAWTLLDMGLMLVEKKNGAGKVIYELPRGASSRDALFPKVLDLDLASTSWITTQNFAGKDSHGGKSSLRYQAFLSVQRELVEPVQVRYQAWIDPKTLAPLAFDDGANVYDLAFAKAPPETLTLPDRFKADLQHYLNANATFKHL